MYIYNLFPAPPPPPPRLQVKNLLSADPYGRQAEKRKKEVTDLETKVCAVCVCVL